MGRKSTDSAAQTKPKTKASRTSGAVKPTKASTSTSGGTPKPPPVMGPKKPRAVESDEVEVDGLLEEPPSKRKKISIPSTTTKNDGRAKPRKDVQSSKSKSVKSPLTAPKTGGNSDPKSTGKKKRAIPEPVEADSEESEVEWVGFGHASEESSEEDEEEGEEEDGDDSSEEELLHGLSSDDGQDSSDEEIELPSIDVSKLPTIAKDDKIVKQKLERAKRQPVRISLIVSLSWSEFRFRRRRRIGE